MMTKLALLLWHISYEIFWYILICNEHDQLSLQARLEPMYLCSLRLATSILFIRVALRLMIFHTAHSQRLAYRPVLYGQEAYLRPHNKKKTFFENLESRR
jgi:hypothetical protein